MPESIYSTGKYLSENIGWHSEDSPWKAEQISKMINKHQLDSTTTVEIGCGAGKILTELSCRYPESNFSGFDPSSDAAKFWREPSKNVTLFNQDFFINPTKYQLLMAIDVIEHIPDYLGFLAKIRPYGVRHIFHIPLELSAQAVIRNTQMKSRESVGHLHYFSKETAIASLKDSGYRILDYAYTPAALDQPARALPKLLNILRRPLGGISIDFASRLLGGWSLLVLAEDKSLHGI